MLVFWSLRVGFATRYVKFYVEFMRRQQGSLPRLESFKELSWYETGAALSHIRGTEAWRERYRSFEDLIKEIAAVVEKTPRGIRRYQTSYKFAERLRREGRLEKVEDAVRIPEVTLDCLARLDRIDPSAVDTILKDLPSNIPTYAEARKMLDAASKARMENLEPRAYSRRSTQQSVDFWKDLVLIECKRFSRDYQSPQRATNLPFAISADIVALGRSHTWCDAFYLFFCENDKSSVSTTVAKAAWSARFFRKYWICLIPSLKDSQAAEEAAALINTANLANIGILRRKHDHWDTIRRPEQDSDQRSAEARAHLLASVGHALD